MAEQTLSQLDASNRVAIDEMTDSLTRSIQAALRAAVATGSREWIDHAVAIDGQLRLVVEHAYRAGYAAGGRSRG